MLRLLARSLGSSPGSACDAAPASPLHFPPSLLSSSCPPEPPVSPVSSLGPPQSPSGPPHALPWVAWPRPCLCCHVHTRGSQSRSDACSPSPARWAPPQHWKPGSFLGRPLLPMVFTPAGPRSSVHLLSPSFSPPFLSHSQRFSCVSPRLLH